MGVVSEADLTPLPSSESQRLILYVDMDCFYASVAVRDRPDLKGRPVIVCPSPNANRSDELDYSSCSWSTSEVSSCTYEARALGVSETRSLSFFFDPRELTLKDDDGGQSR